MKTSLRNSWKHLGKTSLRYLEDVSKTSSKRLQDILKISWRGFCKTPWKRLADKWLRQIYSSWSKRLQDVFIKANVFWKDYFLTQGSKFLKMLNRVGRCKTFCGFGPTKTVNFETFSMISHAKSFLSILKPFSSTPRLGGSLKTTQVYFYW